MVGVEVGTCSAPDDGSGSAGMGTALLACNVRSMSWICSGVNEATSAASDLAELVGGADVAGGTGIAGGGVRGSWGGGIAS